MFITVMIAYLTGLAFNQSLYYRALRSKQVPFLRHAVPSVNQNLRAKMLMEPNPISLSIVSKVSEIDNALSYGYAYFPVINKSNHVVGCISSDIVITLIQNKAFYSKTYSGQTRSNTLMMTTGRNTNQTQV